MPAIQRPKMQLCERIDSEELEGLDESKLQEKLDNSIHFHANQARLRGHRVSIEIWEILEPDQDGPLPPPDAVYETSETSHAFG